MCFDGKVREYEANIISAIGKHDIKIMQDVYKVEDTEKRLGIIKGFRDILNTIYKAFSNAGKEFSGVTTFCERTDYYWSFRERCITGEFNYMLPSIS